MGSKFSSGQFKNCKSIINLDLVRIKSLLFRFEKTVDRNFEEYTFMTKKQFQYTLKLTDKQTYILFRRFDPDGYGRVAMMDVFGALCLASSDDPGVKIGWAFALMDLDKDEHISKIDLLLLLRCVTRGFSKLKDNAIPEMRTLHKIVRDAFALDTNTLDEKGNLSLSDLRTFILSDDLCRTYMANLGTEIAVVDTGKLVIQRAQTTAKLAEIENELKLLKLQAAAEQEDKERYDKERGGDAALVRLTEEAMAEYNREKLKTADDAFENEMADLQKANQNEAIDGVMTEAQRLRRLNRRKDNTAEQNEDSQTLKDAVVFLQGCKPSQGKAMGFDSALEQAMLYKWEMLKPQCEDKLVKLDVDLLEDIFEAGGMSLTDNEAIQCLEAAKSNQLGRTSLPSILEWYRDYRTNPPSLHPSPWLTTAKSIRATINSSRDKIFDFAEKMRIQKALKKKYKWVQDNRLLSRGITPAPDAEAQSAIGEVKGAARLAAWQRQEQLSDPSRLTYSFSFGINEDDEPGANAKDDKNSASSKSKSDSFMKNLKQAKEKIMKERNRWNGMIELDIINTPDSGNDAEKLLVDENQRLTKELNAIGPSDVLSYFSRREGIQDDIGNTVCWFFLEVADSSTDDEAECLLITILNFLQSIPHDYRKDLYDKVYGELVVYSESRDDDDDDKAGSPPDNEGTAEDKIADDNDNVTDEESDEDASKDTDEDEKKDAKEGETEAYKSETRRLILIALCYPGDWLRQFEDECLPPTLLLSRCLRHLHVKMDLEESLEKLYEWSLPYEHYTEKLFGPQEEELGEEGMNPIRFAKLCKERIKVAQDMIDHAEKVESEEIKRHLNVRGLSDEGTLFDIRSRMQRMFQHQVDIMGFGELSGFGEEICKKIFRKYDKNGDESFELWELNDWLMDLQTDTVVDLGDYKALLKELELATDKNGNLRSDGLVHYYERFGRLAEDMYHFGIGSIDDGLHGKGLIQIEFHQSALRTFLKLLDPHHSAFAGAKKLCNMVAACKDFLMEGTYESLSKIPWWSVFFPELLDVLKNPGWIVRKIHQLAEILADGDHGIVRSMKLDAIDKFGTFGTFDSRFAQVFADQQKGSSQKPNTPNTATSRKVKDKERDKKDKEKKNKGEESVASKLESILPTLMDSVGLEEAIASSIHEAERIRDELRSDVLMTRAAKEGLRERLHQAELDTEMGIKNLNEATNLCAAHGSAFYDALRIYATGILSAGIGTKEFYGRLVLNGMDFTNFLPRASGEPSLRRHRDEDRVKKATKRKHAALAAMERERARRFMTDEERDQQQKDRKAKQQQKRDEEEASLFNDAYISMTGARDRRVGDSQVKKFMELWKKLAMMCEQRYPNSMKAAIAMNNYGLAMKEFASSEATWIAQSVQWCEKAAIMVMKILEPFNEYFDVHSNQSNKEGEQLVHGKKAAGYLLILQNYTTLLRDNMNMTALRKYIDHRVCIWKLEKKITTKDRKTINKERKFEGLMIFPYGNVEENLAKTHDEVLVHNEDLRQQEEEAMAAVAQAMKDQSNNNSDDESSAMESSINTGSMDYNDPEYIAMMQRKERLKKEKERKKKRQKEKEIRKEAIRSRNKLYAMITSDQITEFFSERAEHPDLADQPLPWLIPAPEEEVKEKSTEGDAGTRNQLGSPDGINNDLAEDSFVTEFDGDPNMPDMSPDEREMDPSMSQLSMGSDFLLKEDSLDSLSKLDSVVELDDNGEREGHNDDADETKIKKKKSIFGWLFRNRK